MSKHHQDEEHTTALAVILGELVRGLGGGCLSLSTPALLKLLDRALRTEALPPPVRGEQSDHR